MPILDVDCFLVLEAQHAGYIYINYGFCPTIV